MRHHAGTDRIALRIGQGGPEVEPVERAGEEAVLPEVSGPARADVVVLGVTAVDATQQDGQRVLVFRDGDEVDVIGHQAEADDPDACISEVFAEEAEVGQVVVGRGEGGAAVDAALGDVAGDVGQQRAIPSGHPPNQWAGGRESLKNRSVQADPFSVFPG